MHLWEINHNYYCSEGECNHFKSWADFLSEFGNADNDYNLVFRWDWYEGENWDCGEHNGDDYYRNGRLALFFAAQRKGYIYSASVEVCRADEPAVREYLKARYEYLKALWEPLTQHGTSTT